MAASAAAQGIHASYTIRMGDTLADICNQYYGSLDKLELLCQVNHISDANLIMPGAENRPAVKRTAIHRRIPGAPLWQDAAGELL